MSESVNMSLSAKLKAKAIELISESSVHGTDKVVTSKSLLRCLFWGLVILSAWIYCLINLTSIITEYQQYQVVTNIETIFEVERELPAVTFCHNNRSSVICIYKNAPCPSESIRHIQWDIIFGECSVLNSGDK